MAPGGRTQDVSQQRLQLMRDSAAKHTGLFGTGRARTPSRGDADVHTMLDEAIGCMTGDGGTDALARLAKENIDECLHCRLTQLAKGLVPVLCFRPCLIGMNGCARSATMFDYVLGAADLVSDCLKKGYIACVDLGLISSPTTADLDYTASTAVKFEVELLCARACVPVRPRACVMCPCLW